MSLPFLKAESEETATQAAAFVGIVIITVGLTVMNVTGAIAGSQGDSPGQIIIRIALAVILSGAELLAAVALVRVMLAANWWRKLAGSLIFLGLAWACIQNGKRAVHLIYPEFEESAALLKARAEIAGTDATTLEEAQKAAIAATPVELAAVRERIATLEGHQELMQAKTPEKIMEAQRLLTVTGDYVGEIDGKAERLTEAAMRSYGETVATELQQLRRRETSLSSGAVIVSAPVVSGDEQPKPPAVLKAEYEEKARKAASATIWLEVMLWVFEIARSFGLWALVTTITAKRKDDAIDEGISSEVPDGHVRVEIPQDEWDAMQEAMRVHGNIKQGAKKGATTRRRGNKIEAAGDYYRDKIAGWMEAHNQGVPTVAIANGSGLTVAQMRMTYGPHMTEEEHAALFFTGPIEQPAPEEPEAPVAVADSPQEETPATDELDSEPKSQDYPVANYEPPANDDPDSKEAA